MKNPQSQWNILDYFWNIIYRLRGLPSLNAYHTFGYFVFSHYFMAAAAASPVTQVFKQGFAPPPPAYFLLLLFRIAVWNASARNQASSQIKGVGVGKRKCNRRLQTHADSASRLQLIVLIPEVSCVLQND